MQSIMQPTLRTFGITLALSAMAMTATSAMAVLPTVALDPNASATGTAQTTTNLTLAPASPIVFNPSNSMPPMPTAVVPTVGLPAVSQSASQVQKRLLASIVSRDAAGNEVLSPLTAQTQVTSGNVIEYHGYVINQSPERVRNVKVTFDLPSNTELTGLADMSPSRAYGSVDRQNFQYMPLKANIGGVIQEIPMSSYKAIRWDIAGLGLNEVAEVKYRVRVK